jgi:hypothetical protein
VESTPSALIGADSRGGRIESNDTRGGHLLQNKVEDHGSKSLAIVALIIASASLMGMFWAISDAHRAQTDAKVATMRVEGLTRAMIAHGIKDTYPHLPGEDD